MATKSSRGTRKADTPSDTHASPRLVTARVENPLNKNKAGARAPALLIDGTGIRQLVRLEPRARANSPGGKRRERAAGILLGRQTAPPVTSVGTWIAVIPIDHTTANDRAKDSAEDRAATATSAGVRATTVLAMSTLAAVRVDRRWRWTRNSGCRVRVWRC